MISNQNLQTPCAKFYCKCCDYSTSRKSSYDEHNLSTKHQTAMISNQNLQISNQNLHKICNEYICQNCNKKYKDNSGLWRHKKKCNPPEHTVNVLEKETNNSNKNTNTEQNLEQKIDIYDLVKFLMKENSDIKHMMIEQQSKMMEQQNIVLEIAKNGTTSHSNNTTHTNSNNKAFNLNLFLNETCKDAMNINDFVESIKLQVSDLENVGEVGFVEGISTIIVKNLNALDITKRPIHCTDKKRETIYIKDENVWEKDESQCKMRRMIKKVVSKNQRLIPKFKEQNPEYNKSYSKVSDKYNKLIIESMGGSGDNDAEKEDKIVRNIVKNVVVDK